MATRNIDTLYNFYLYVCRKERGIFVTTSKFTANLDAAQMEVFEEYFKLYGVNQTIHDAIRPFRVYYQFTSDAAGFVTYPADYLHIVGTAFTVTGSTMNEITMPNEDEFVGAVNSQLRPVSNAEPVGRDTSTGFSIYPQSTQIGFFTYLRRPATPVWGGTQVGRVLTYNSGTSTQLEWSDSYINAVLATAFKFAGINMDEQGISQFADQFEKETE